MKKMLKFLLVAGLIGLAPFCVKAEGYDDIINSIVAEDEYDLRIRLYVPQVVNNTESLGKRVFRLQTISGSLFIYWLNDGSCLLDFDNLVNKNFKVGGKNVTYKGVVDYNVVYPRFNYIGNNRTNIFRIPCMSFYLELEPSYAIGGNTEDNSFYLLLAGNGTSSLTGTKKIRIARYFYGHASGTQGCGCYAYGHTSPTRKATVDGPSDIVEDVVPTYGRWNAKLKKRTYLKSLTTIYR